jgi:hypothetical protein
MLHAPINMTPRDLVQLLGEIVDGGAIWNSLKGSDDEIAELSDALIPFTNLWHDKRPALLAAVGE